MEAIVQWGLQPGIQRLLLASGGLILLLGFFVLARRLRQQRRQMQQLEREMTQLRQDLDRAPAPALTESVPDKPVLSSFSQQLQQVEQQPSLGATTHRPPPEKYRYVSSLAQQGMTAEQIATALHLSVPEVQQAIELGSLSPANGGPASGRGFGGKENAGDGR